MTDHRTEIQRALSDLKEDLAQLKGQQNDLVQVQVKLASLDSQIGDLQKVIGAPFYKDRRFWAGLAAIPLLIASGWTVDKVFEGRLVVLPLIHAALGTQPVVLNAIETDGDPLRKGLQTALTTLLATNDLMGPAVDAAVKKRFDIVATGILELGLNRLERVHLLPCKDIPGFVASPGGNDACEDLSDARTLAATSVFGLRSYDKVDIDIGVYVAEIPRAPSGQLDFTTLEDPKKPIDIEHLLKITVDDADLALPAPKVWIQNEIGNKEMRMAYLRVESAKVRVPDASFPLHTFTVQLNSGAPDNYVVSLAFMVEVHSKQD